jgi:hypothetical protein
MSNIQKVDLEPKLDTKKVFRIGLFGLSSLTFIIFVIVSIFKFKTDYHENDYDFWTLALILLFLGTSIGSIITNMDRLNEIKTKIININNNLSPLPPDESLSYSSNLWIFPLVSFIYVCIFIGILIILNSKCNYIKLNKVQDYYNIPYNRPQYYNRTPNYNTFGNSQNRVYPNRSGFGSRSGSRSGYERMY